MFLEAQHKVPAVVSSSFTSQMEPVWLPRPRQKCYGIIEREPGGHLDQRGTAQAAFESQNVSVSVYLQLLLAATVFWRQICRLDFDLMRSEEANFSAISPFFLRPLTFLIFFWFKRFTVMAMNAHALGTSDATKFLQKKWERDIHRCDLYLALLSLWRSVSKMKEVSVIAKHSPFWIQKVQEAEQSLCSFS